MFGKNIDSSSLRFSILGLIRPFLYSGGWVWMNLDYHSDKHFEQPQRQNITSCFESFLVSSSTLISIFFNFISVFSPYVAHSSFIPLSKLLCLTSSLKMYFAVAVNEGFWKRSVGIRAAFLQAKGLDRRVYMELLDILGRRGGFGSWRSHYMDWMMCHESFGWK